MSWLTDGLEDIRQHGLSPASFLSQNRGDAIYKAALLITLGILASHRGSNTATTPTRAY